MNRFIFAVSSIIQPAPRQKPLSTLRIAFNAFPSTVDPRKTGDFVSSTLICLIYEGLTRCLPDGSVEPALAERIEISRRSDYLYIPLAPRLSGAMGSL